MSFGGSVLAAAGDLKGSTELWTAGVSDTERLLAKNENPYSHVGWACSTQNSLETLKRAVENGFLNLPMLEYLSRPMMAFHSLRDDPEFDAIRADLARRIGELRARY